MPLKTEAWKAMVELKKGNTRGLESIIRFLERDEYKRGTGYLKEAAWTVLKRAPLTEKQKERLRTVALAYLRRRIRREFWYMCRFAPRIANAAFRGRIEQLTESKEANVRQRAVLVNAYLRSIEQGERTRWEFRFERAACRANWI